MKKQKMQLTILLGILVLLIMGFWGVEYYNGTQSKKLQEETGEILVDISENDIVKFYYDYQGISYAFEKEEDIWYYAEDTSIPMKQYLINSMVKKLAPFKVLQVIENVEDMSQYGLEQVQRTISFETQEESYTFYVGDNNSLSEIYYICQPSENTVYTLETSVISAFNYTLEEMTEEVEETQEESTELESDSTEIIDETESEDISSAEDTNAMEESTQESTSSMEETESVESQKIQEETESENISSAEDTKAMEESTQESTSSMEEIESVES